MHQGIRGLLLVTLLTTILWYCSRGRYYEWVLDAARPLDVVIMCDTAGFRGQPCTALVLYDRVALSPVALAFGLYRRRPPERIKTYLPRWVPLEAVEADSAWIREVPSGPIVAIQIGTRGTNYCVDIRDPEPKGGRLVVRPEWPRGVMPLPVGPLP